MFIENKLENMLDPLFVIGLASGVAMVTLIVGCMRCHCRRSNREKQQGSFQMLKKRCGHRFFSDRIDYVRNVSGISGQEISFGNASVVTKDPENNNINSNNNLPPAPQIIPVHVQTPSAGSEHSFFDDSFQTVIEASSSSCSSVPPKGGSLKLPSQNSYLSLHKLSTSALYPARSNESLDSKLPKEGELNGGFSDSSLSSDESSAKSLDSLDAPYLVPLSERKIKVVKPNVHRSPQLTAPRSELARRLLDLKLQRSGSFRRHSDIGVISETLMDNEREREQFDRQVNLHDDSWGDGDSFEAVNSRKLMFVGGGSDKFNNDRRHSYDTMTLYEKLRQSKMQEKEYKAINKVKLVLPSRVRGVCDGAEDSFISPCSKRRKLSQKSEHTYDSIASDLAASDNRHGAVDESVMNDLSRATPLSSTAYHEFSHDNFLDASANRGSFSDEQNTTCSAHHTYETIPSETRQSQPVTSDTCENCAIIIGKRVSNPFENKFIKRPINKKKQNMIADNRFVCQIKFQRDLEDRYSPFPSTKKLAFKSMFSQVASPRYPAGHHVNPVVNARLDFSCEKIEVRTPEIKVDNQTLMMENTEFYSPYTYLNPTPTRSLESIPPLAEITTEDVYQTFKARENLKLKGGNLNPGGDYKTASYKKRLPSLSDSLDEELRNHCNDNEFVNSTPSELPEVCNYF